MTASSASLLKIRPATWRDLASLVAIERVSFSDPWNEDAFASVLGLPHMLVLVSEQDEPVASHRGDAAARVTGYVVALVAGPEGEIADLAVAPAERGRGLGRALLERALAELTGRRVRTVFLEVRESNHAARALYQSSGFESVGRRRGYYRQPAEDALLLRREIGAS